MLLLQYCASKIFQTKEISKQYQTVETKYKEMNPLEHTCRMNKQHGGQNNMESRTGTRKKTPAVSPAHGTKGAEIPYRTVAAA